MFSRDSNLGAQRFLGAFKFAAVCSPSCSSADMSPDQIFDVGPFEWRWIDRRSLAVVRVQQGKKDERGRETERRCATSMVIERHGRVTAPDPPEPTNAPKE